MMTIICRVACEFRNGAEGETFRVGPDRRFSLISAPDWVRGDPLFALLEREGALEAVVSAGQKRALEKDPAAGAAPDGTKHAAPAGKK